MNRVCVYLRREFKKISKFFFYHHVWPHSIWQISFAIYIITISQNSQQHFFSQFSIFFILFIFFLLKKHDFYYKIQQYAFFVLLVSKRKKKKLHHRSFPVRKTTYNIFFVIFIFTRAFFFFFTSLKKKLLLLLKNLWEDVKENYYRRMDIFLIFFLFCFVQMVSGADATHTQKKYTISFFLHKT